VFKPEKIIVVGGNAAGPAAAAKAKRVNPGAEVVIFESGDFISTGTCEIPYVLSGEIPDYKEIITLSPGEFTKKKGVKVFTNCEVLNINRGKKFIKVYNKNTHKEFEENYDSLILATGSIPKKIQEFPEFAPNLFTLKNISDLINITDYVRSKNIESAAIIGSGFIGLEAADAFHNSGKEVTIIEKENYPLPYTEPEVRALILELLKNNGIMFHGAYKSLLLNIENGFISSINIDGRLIEPGIIISAVGFTPNNILARDAGLQISSRGGIKVDRNLKTSDPNIWACGDNIEIINEVTKEKDYFPVATIAHDFAHIAGENAAGGNAFTNSVVKNIAIKILDKFHISVGITEKEAKDKSIPCKSVEAVTSNLVKVMPGSGQVYGKIVYHAVKKNILGAVFFGGKEVSGYGDIIAALIKLKSPANILGDFNYNYTPPLSPFINLLSILGRKIK
jgi:NADPH-dependent 2,4-dienoyl-CoA reductase/sulfur reductase-like enzyme